MPTQVVEQLRTDQCQRFPVLLSVFYFTSFGILNLVNKIEVKIEWILCQLQYSHLKRECIQVRLIVIICVLLEATVSPRTLLLYSSVQHSSYSAYNFD